MKLLVFADTHGYTRQMLEVVRQNQDAAAVFHLGDGDGDAEILKAAFPAIHVYVVRGNCDAPGPYPLDGMATFAGMSIFYTHGHTYGVKSDLTKLWIAAKTAGAQAALFGHTHTPHYEFRAGIHLFNPGSISLTRIDSVTYGLIQLGKGEPKFDILPYQQG